MENTCCRQQNTFSSIRHFRFFFAWCFCFKFCNFPGIINMKNLKYLYDLRRSIYFQIVFKVQVSILEFGKFHSHPTINIDFSLFFFKLWFLFLPKTRQWKRVAFRSFIYRRTAYWLFSVHISISWIRVADRWIFYKW